MIALSTKAGINLSGAVRWLVRISEPYLTVLIGSERIPGRTDFAALKPSTRVLLVGLAGWMMLVVAVTVIALGALQLSRIEFSGWFGRQVTQQNGVASSRLSYDDIVRRPLFSRSRRVAEPPPPVAVVSQPVAATLDQNLTLKGVYMNGETVRAYLRSAQSPLGAWVKVNDEIDGWRIVSIRPQHVLLEGQGQRLDLDLNVRGK